MPHLPYSETWHARFARQWQTLGCLWTPIQRMPRIVADACFAMLGLVTSENRRNCMGINTIATKSACKDTRNLIAVKLWLCRASCRILPAKQRQREKPDPVDAVIGLCLAANALTTDPCGCIYVPLSASLCIVVSKRRVQTPQTKRNCCLFARLTRWRAATLR